MGMFKELDKACADMTTELTAVVLAVAASVPSELTAVVLAVAASVPSLSADRAKEFREGARRLARALREAATTIERVADEACERRPS